MDDTAAPRRETRMMTRRAVALGPGEVLVTTAIALIDYFVTGQRPVSYAIFPL